MVVLLTQLHIGVYSYIALASKATIRVNSWAEIDDDDYTIMKETSRAIRLDPCLEILEND
jgi:hypothetical protein